MIKYCKQYKVSSEFVYLQSLCTEPTEKMLRLKERMPAFCDSSYKVETTYCFNVKQSKISEDRWKIQKMWVKKMKNIETSVKKNRKYRNIGSKKANIGMSETYFPLFLEGCLVLGMYHVKLLISKQGKGYSFVLVL